jgi:hypothetical protein
MNCPKCWNPSIPDNATSCPACGAIFDQTAQQFGRLCPSGKHTMDPTWTSCAFCKAESPGTGTVAEPHRPTVSESTRGNSGVFSGHGTAIEIPQPPVAASDARKTRLDQSGFGIPQPIAPPPAIPVPPYPAVPQASSGGKRQTVFNVQPPTPELLTPVAAAVVTQPRIVAVLVCYSNLLNPAGTVYSVREGRNKIGANPDNEVAFLTDPTMSGWHASVTYRDGKYYLSAKDTMTGTYLNGVEVPPDSTTLLPNYADIRAGSTAFRFIMVDPIETQAS